MAENTAGKDEAIRKTDLYRHNHLPAGGELYIFDQFHSPFYPQEVIENDIKEVRPDILIIENGRATGLYAEPFEEVLPDVRHQMGLARQLGIPYVLPDVTGLLPDKSYQTDVFFKIATEEVASAKQKETLRAIALSGAGALGSIFAISIAAFRMKDTGIDRRKFLKMFGLGLGGAALGGLPAVGSIVKGAIRQNLTGLVGNIDANLQTRVLSEIVNRVNRVFGDVEAAMPVVMELRNDKFRKIASMSSRLLQQEGRQNPKVGLVVGATHSQFLEDTSVEADTPEIVKKSIGGIFLPTYHVLLKEVSNNSLRKQFISDRAAVDLVLITCAAVYKFKDADSETAEQQGFLISEELYSSILTAIRREPELLKSYRYKMEAIKQKNLLKSPISKR